MEEAKSFPGGILDLQERLSLVASSSPGMGFRCLPLLFFAFLN